MNALRRLPSLLRPYRLPLGLSISFLVVATIARLAVPVIIREVIDRGLAGGQVSLLFFYGLAIMGIGLLRAAVAFGQRYLAEWVSLKVAFDLRNRLFDHIQHLSFSYHDHAQSGQLISRGIEDVRSTRHFTGFGLQELLYTALLFAGVIAMMASQEPELALVALLPMLPLLLMTTRFGARVSRIFLTVDQALGVLSSRLQENVIGAPVVRAFAREPYEIERFDEGNRELYQARVQVIRELSKVMPTTRLLVAVSTTLILWFGGRQVLAGAMTIGELVAFNTYLLLLAQPAQQLAWMVNLAGEAAAGLARIFQILDHPAEIQSPPGAVHLPPLTGRVDIQNVSVQYRGESVRALSEINLTAEPNQIVALIGATGSGKTTLVNLIPRFYDVTAGEVRVDGVDVRTAELASLRRQIGIVPQTSLLFSASIRENIAFGRPEAAYKAIEAAARAAQAHEFIQALPQGYDTVVGERGVTLSGGQRQRVAIARALLLDPRILILDDSTSSVDIETERLIQQALDHLMEGRTTFVIAQRLSTIRRADQILVLEGGRIVERGRHGDLLQAGGLYREIYEMQLNTQETALSGGPD